MNAKELKLRLALACQQHFPIPLYWGFESPGVFAASPPFVYLDHAYFDRGYEQMNFRVVLNGIHQTLVRHDLPDDRMRKFCPFPRPWRNTGAKVIVIPIAPNHGKWHSDEDWTERTVERLRQHTAREVVVKPKAGALLSEVLGDAWAVISHSSVAGVEAAYQGVPVFGPETSPAFHVGEEDLSRIEEPLYADRDAWLRTLSYSQFHLSEIVSGYAWEVLKGIYGDFDSGGAEDRDHQLVQAL